MQTIKAYNIDGWKVFDGSKNGIIANLEACDFSTISFDEPLYFSNNIVEFTDLEHPLVISNMPLRERILYINQEYYINNKEEIIELIKYVCKNKNEKYLEISNVDLINEEVISSACENKNIETLKLGNRDEPYFLKEEDYNLIKSSDIKEVNTNAVCNELKNVFDPIIGYNMRKKLFDIYSYTDINTRNTFSIDDELLEEQIENFKLLNPGTKVRFNFDNYDMIFKAINYINENQLDIDCVIHVKNKNNFNSYIFNNFELKEFANVSVKVDLETIKLTDYVKNERMLESMIEPAKDLSPFEKFLYAYNLTKLFKQYKESDNNKFEARNIYEILNNEYMVCVGYAKMLGVLLEKLGIESAEYSVEINVGMDDLDQDIEVMPEDVNIEWGGHARRKVRLKDDKYGIDGIFVSDPTWDNRLENDSYIYSLLTPMEYNGMRRENGLRFTPYIFDEMFFAASEEEFFKKVNIWMDKNNKNNVEKDFIKPFLEKEIKKIDSEFYGQILEKHPNLEEYLVKISNEEIQDIMGEFSEYIVSKTNTPITGEQYKEAITVLYSKIYSFETEEQLHQYVNETMEYNKERFSKAFPTRYMIRENGERIPIINEFNKFDLEENLEKGNSK